MQLPRISLPTAQTVGNRQGVPRHGEQEGVSIFPKALEAESIQPMIAKALVTASV